MPFSSNSKYPYRIAHISDLHFSKVSFDPGQFFSKRWLGNGNLLIFRKKRFAHEEIDSLLHQFKREGVQLVVVTGDLTSTAQKSEFELAQTFLNRLKNANLDLLVVPGNHDHYTKRAFATKRFYRYFSKPLLQELPCSSWSLEEHGIAVQPLKNSWWAVSLDTALATSLFSSQGLFSQEHEQRLHEALSQIPPDQNIVVINHFPLFSNESFRKQLLRSEELKKVLKQFPHVRLYLHGHTHRRSLADLRSLQLPIVADAGSIGMRPSPSWNLLQLDKQSLHFQSHFCTNEQWQSTPINTFTW